MSTEPNDQPPAPEPDPPAVREPTDDELATTLADTVPGCRDAAGEPTDLGNKVYQAIQRAIGLERARAGRICRAVAQTAGKTASMAGGAARAHALSGDRAKAAEANHVAQLSGSLAQGVGALARMIETPPGACKECGDTKQVRSTLSLASGAAAAVPCPSCTTDGARPT